MSKKPVLVVAGALVALVVAAPVASATETAPTTHHPPSCLFHGGDAGAASAISGASLANAVAQAPLGGNNVGNIGNCSSFLNDNANGNLSGNAIPILGAIFG